MTRRINARLDAEVARKVDALRRQTGQSTTEIVKASLEAYYVVMTRDQGAAVRFADFVGSAKGPRSLSSNYKKTLQRSLARKA